MPEILCTCDSCGESGHENSFIFLDDNVYCCETCANNENYYTCADCGRWSHDNDSGNNDNGDLICQRCYDHYTRCERCENITHNDNSFYDENSGNDYCESCFNRISRDNVIQEYAFRPEFLFSKMPWENTIYYGIELETELEQDKNRVNKVKELQTWMKAHDLNKYVYCKDDGSLVNGVEFCFHPATLQAIHKQYMLRPLFKHMTKMGFKAYESGRCGLHVHISKKKLSEASQLRGKMFFYKCQPYLKTLSGRKQDGFGYCKFDSRMPNSLEDSQSGRYTALNIFASDNTIEIRIFRATLNHDKFIAYLQFCDAFIAFIQCSGTAFYKTANPAQLWHSFIDYTKKQNKSGCFIKYILRKGIV